MGTVSLTANIRFCYNKTAEFYRFHSDLIAGCVLTTFYTNLLAHKIFKNFPEKIANFSRVGLSFIGVISLNYLFDELKHSYKVLCRFTAVKKTLGMLLSAAKVIYQATNVLLTVGGFIVSLAALYGWTHWIMIFYTAVRVYATAAVALSAVCAFSDYVVNKKLVNGTMPDRGLWMKAQLSKWNKEEIKNEKNDVLTREKILARHVTWAQNQFGMTVVGYGILGTRALKPETILSALVTWAMSAAHLMITYKGKFAKG